MDTTPSNLTEYHCKYVHNNVVCLVRVNWHLGSRCSIVIREPKEFIGISLEVEEKTLTPLNLGRLIKTTEPYTDLTEDEKVERLRFIREAREKPIKVPGKKSPKALEQEKRKKLLKLPLDLLEKAWSQYYE